MAFNISSIAKLSTDFSLIQAQANQQSGTQKSARQNLASSLTKSLIPNIMDPDEKSKFGITDSSERETGLMSALSKLGLHTAFKRAGSESAAFGRQIIDTIV